MTFDAGDHASLTYLIQREKEAEERLEALRDEVLTWVKRGKLAVQADRPDLALEAKTRVLQAKQQFDQAESELSSIRLQRESFKAVQPHPDVERTIQAEVLLEQFRMQGFSPEEQEVRDLASRMEAELALKAIKAPASATPESRAEVVAAEAPTVATPEGEAAAGLPAEGTPAIAEVVASQPEEGGSPDIDSVTGMPAENTPAIAEVVASQPEESGSPDIEAVSQGPEVWEPAEPACEATTDIPDGSLPGPEPPSTEP